MKAQVLYGIGNIKYAETNMPVPKKGEALVKVSHCGICGSDIPRIYKSGAHNMPIIPGHEFSGVVEDCKDKPALVGKRVGIYPLIPCMGCAQCESGHYEMCQNYNYLGSRCDGGFAEYVTVPIWNLVPLPDEVSDIEAAMLEPMGVAVHSLRRCGLLTDKYEINPDHDDVTVLVCGLGTIGLLTAMFLSDAGFPMTYCIGNKDIQKKKLFEMGYSEYNFCDVRYEDTYDFVKSLRGGNGVNYYFECIGRSESYEQAIKSTAPLGTVMLVGNPASDMELSRETYWKILRNQMRVLGTWNSSYEGRNARKKCYQDDWQYVINRLVEWKSGKRVGPGHYEETADGEEYFVKFSPENLVSHCFSLEDMHKGLDIMKRKSEDYVKIMVKMV
ncbi:galactitol-1-phosphate 5-dehydrogenase [Butyrivibrio sp. VCB2006]|uniref:galactitol-1-phosphate 5-dehydrogenase n=1 Tax=Butyrivibrio sp. VCB2006 TaxID=1280679 RepID=UPI0003FEBA89|nr:galactitol-1-phosphate 5-dehydrogenase [Butyrivibrio sp. VCB2006]